MHTQTGHPVLRNHVGRQPTRDKEMCHGERVQKGLLCPHSVLLPEFFALKHKSRILGHPSNPECGFSMMEQVRLCAVWPMENWIASSLKQIQGWKLSENPTLVL